MLPPVANRGGLRVEVVAISRLPATADAAAVAARLITHEHVSLPVDMPTGRAVLDLAP